MDQICTESLQLNSLPLLILPVFSPELTFQHYDVQQEEWKLSTQKCKALQGQINAFHQTVLPAIHQVTEWWYIHRKMNPE